MLDRLGEFGTRRGRHLGSAAVALVLHLALILVVVRATNAAASASEAAGRDTIRLELAPPSPRPLSSAPPESQVPLPAPVPPIDFRSEPLRLDFSGIDAGRPRLDLDALAGLSGPTDSAAAGTASGPPVSALPVDQADEAPDLLGGLQPRYPESLRSTGLTGRVELEYVISTRGRVEPGSVRVLRSTHPAFAMAAREALVTARFTPARRGGRAVAVLVRQAMRFVVQ